MGKQAGSLSLQLETERRMGVRQQQMIDELRAENAQLRAALTMLTDLWDSLAARDGPVQSQGDWKRAWRAAHEALGRSEEC